MYVNPFPCPSVTVSLTRCLSQLPLSFITALMSAPVAEYPRFAPGSDEMGWSIRTAYTWIFGVGTAILVPLVALAVGVNHIAKFTEAHVRQRQKSRSGDRDDNTEASSHDDESDDSSLDDEIRSRRSRGGGGGRWKPPYRPSVSDPGVIGTDDSDGNAQPSRSDVALDIDPDYALLFGRWKFHVNIPILRRLWRYTTSVPLCDDFSIESFRVYDYPFHRWVERPMGRLALRLGLETWWVWLVGGDASLTEGMTIGEFKGWWRRWRRGRRRADGRSEKSRRAGVVVVGAGPRPDTPDTPESGDARGQDGGEDKAQPAEDIAGKSWTGTEDSERPTSPAGGSRPPSGGQLGRWSGHSRESPRSRSSDDRAKEGNLEETERPYPAVPAGARVVRQRYIDVLSSDEDGLAFGRRVRGLERRRTRGSPRSGSS